MATIDPDNNIGFDRNPPIDETLVTQGDTSSSTPVAPAEGTGQAGIEDSVSELDGVSTQQTPFTVPDVSLLTGVNPDNFLSFSGFDALTAPLSRVSDVFSGGLNLDGIADEFGISGILGNLPISINTNVQPKLDPLQNVLHQYASHTYRISMGALDPNGQRIIQDDNFTQGVPQIAALLMSSGGNQEIDNVARDPIFEEDFFIEDLRMNTIIGSNAQGNGSNAVSLEFNIYEPHAVSLIERLLALAEKLGYKNYIEIPYVFKIEFIGYDDAGNQLGIIPQTTRYIPFTLAYLRFEIKGSGAVYQCTALPTNHMTFNQTVATLPEAIEVPAGTVGEFFNGRSSGANGVNTVGGLVETVNAYHNKLTTKVGADSKTGETLRNFADKIRIVVHDDIASGTLSVGNLSKLGMINEGEIARNGPMNPTKPLYGFGPGTSINSIIEQIIKNSSFYIDQIEEAERIDEENRVAAGNAVRTNTAPPRPKKKKPFIDFRITSSYKMTAYDEKANRYAYEATFYVNPIEKVAVQSTLMGKQEVESVAKEYNYLFTGQNQDILDIDLSFNLAFYNEVSSNLESVSEGTPPGNTKKLTGNDPGNNLSNNCDPVNRVVVDIKPSPAHDNTGTATKEDRKKMKAADFRRSIMQDSVGDMITFDIKILGDPAFIKQDDILYRDDGDIQNPFTANGAIKTDKGDMFIRLKFKVFDDIDHDTGLRVEARQLPNATFNRRSTFDGFYRVLTVENVFQNGEFTQNLVVVRTYVQEECDEFSEDNTDQDSGLVSLEEPAEASVTLDAFGGAGADLTNRTLSTDQQVNEQRNAGDSNRPAINSATVATDEPLPTVDAESIVELTILPAVNADRFL